MEDLERNVKRKIEMEQERGDAERIAAKHLEARMHAQAQKKEALAHFKAVWEAQKSLKGRGEELENCFR